MKKTLMCVVLAVMVLTLAPGAWADGLDNLGGCVTLEELVNAPQATEMIVIAPVGRKKTDPVTVCDPGEPNGGGSSATCEAYYQTTGSYACTTGTASSPSCSVPGACNLPTGGTGTKCKCTHWCVTSSAEPEPL